MYLISGKKGALLLKFNNMQSKVLSYYLKKSMETAPLLSAIT